MEWEEFGIGFFKLSVGPVSVVLVYRHGKGYKVAVYGWFHETEHPKWVPSLVEAKQLGIQLLMKVLKEATDKANTLIA